MKSLQITLMMAVFCLTISGTSNKTETKLTFSKVQIEAYKKLSNDAKLMAEVTKTNTKKPNQRSL